MKAGYLVLIELILLSVSSAASAQEWPMVQRDPNHTGFSSVGPIPPLKQAWFANAKSQESNFTTWPTVSAGAVVARSGPGVLAVDSRSGKRQWFHGPTEGQTTVAPAMDDRAVYIPIPFGRLLSLDKTSGKERWRFQSPSEIDASPVLIDGRVLIGAAEARQLFSVATSTGTQVWDSNLEFEPNSVPAVTDRLVVLSTQDSDSADARVVALEEGSGKEVWSASQTLGVSSASILNDKVVFGGGDEYAYALDLDTGRRIWRTKVEADFDVRTSPAIAFGDVFLADRTGNMYRLDGDDGRRKWIFRETEGTFDQSFPVVAGKTLFIGGGSGWLYALDVDDGSLQWKHQVGGFILSGAADEERFYFGVKNRNEGLYAYEHDPNGKLEPTSKERGLLGALLGGLFVVALAAVGFLVIKSRKAGTKK